MKTLPKIKSVLQQFDLQAVQNGTLLSALQLIMLSNALTKFGCAIKQITEKKVIFCNYTLEYMNTASALAACSCVMAGLLL